MPALFAHGQLRLYLLSLLDEGAKHGYEIITELSDRFAGTYRPSAGTVYPRLARLEEEGLVERESSGRREVYRLTAAGRQELAERSADLHSLEQDLSRSVRDLAAQVRRQTVDSMSALRADLQAAAQQAREHATSPLPRQAEPDQPPADRAAGMLARSACEGAMTRFRQEIRAVLAEAEGAGTLGAEQVLAVEEALTEAAGRIRRDLLANG